MRRFHHSASHLFRHHCSASRQQQRVHKQLQAPWPFPCSSHTLVQHSLECSFTLHSTAPSDWARSTNPKIQLITQRACSVARFHVLSVLIHCTVHTICVLELFLFNYTYLDTSDRYFACKLFDAVGSVYTSRLIQICLVGPAECYNFDFLQRYRANISEHKASQRAH